MTTTRALPDLSNEEINRYSRHLLLPEVGIEGQKKLKAAKVLIVGAGGLGSPIAMYLAAAGVGCLGLVDMDVVETSNLQRQIIHSTQSVGTLKIDSARRTLAGINPLVEVKTYQQKFTADNAMAVAAEYDFIIDGTDNFPTRYLVNDVSVLQGKPTVYGSIYRFEGQVSVFWAAKGPCYRCLYPEPPPPGLVPNCAEGGVIGVLPGMVGTIQANEAIKLILEQGEPLIGRLLTLDALSMSFRELQLRKNPHCPLCGPKATITGLVDYHLFCGLHPTTEPAALGAEHQIRARDLADRLAHAGVVLLDVRSAEERAICAITPSLSIPLPELLSRLSDIPPGQDLVVYCKSGVRSATAVRLLHEQGFHTARSLVGGIQAWSKTVDDSVPIY
jgi:sulfur-carrier protein adenylyltransferase/sulfurtransferase